MVVTISDGRERTLSVFQIIRMYAPNKMGVFSKVGFYISKFWEFVSAEPREANTEGGIFPAIFGTVMMVFIMSIAVVPLGVLTAVYLKEYAGDNIISRLVRISVSNLAGVPPSYLGCLVWGSLFISSAVASTTCFIQNRCQRLPLAPAAFFGRPLPCRC